MHDGRARVVAQRRQVVRGPEHLVVCERRQGARHVFVDDLAVGDEHRALTRAPGSPSWVTMMMVLPCSTRSSKVLKTIPAVFESRLPVGSSATRMGGSLARARAMATRCCWPPERADGQLVGVVGHLHLLEQLHGALLALVERVHVAEVHRQHDVLDQRQRGQELEELEDDAQVAAAPDGHLVSRSACAPACRRPDLAGGGAVDAGDHVDQRGLAAARLADDADELTCVEVGADPFEHRELARGRS